MKEVIILAIKYAEPEWQQTLRCLLQLPNPIVIIDRNGTGSLAEAINRGICTINPKPGQVVWIVTNVTFKPYDFNILKERFNPESHAAIHPRFASDHQHIAMPLNQDQIINDDVPFLEFTAPLVNAELLVRYPLDEKMPYWGHDLDWGHRIRQAGWKLAVSYESRVEHTYIRNNKFNHPVTLTRKKLRKQTDAATRSALVEKYGPDWNNLLKYPE